MSILGTGTTVAPQIPKFITNSCQKSHQNISIINNGILLSSSKRGNKRMLAVPLMLQKLRWFPLIVFSIMVFVQLLFKRTSWQIFSTCKAFKGGFQESLSTFQTFAQNKLQIHFVPSTFMIIRIHQGSRILRQRTAQSIALRN